MKRIGYCVWTERFRKGTSRKRRRRAYDVFRRSAAISNEVMKRAKPALDKAMLDSLVYGQGAVRVTWDGDFAVAGGGGDYEEQMKAPSSEPGAAPSG